MQDAAIHFTSHDMVSEAIRTIADRYYGPQLNAYLDKRGIDHSDPFNLPCKAFKRFRNTKAGRRLYKALDSLYSIEGEISKANFYGAEPSACIISDCERELRELLTDEEKSAINFH